MIDYLLVGGFAAAGVYTICRLFVGLRKPSTAPMRLDGMEEGNKAADLDTPGRPRP